MSEWKLFFSTWHVRTEFVVFPVADIRIELGVKHISGEIDQNQRLPALAAVRRVAPAQLHDQGPRTEPSLRLALLQIAIGASNWLLMGGAVYMLLQQKIGFPTATGVLLVVAVVGVITHVPAGLGVLEAF